MTRITTLTAALAVALALTGCSSSQKKPVSELSAPGSSFSWLTPYRVDVGQGNFISESMAAQLKEGMTPDQARAALGTPLLVDPFRGDRWDYVFEIRRGDGGRERRRFSLYFREGLLSSWGGDPLPKDSGEGILPSRPSR